MLFACKPNKDLVQPTEQDLKERSVGFLIRHVEKSNLDFEWLGMKLDANLVLSESEEQNFKATVRMREDSAMSISISPALGIEMLRALIDRDSVQVVSEIPGDKWYFKDSNESLYNLLKLELDLKTLQYLFIGNPVGLTRDEGKLKSTIEGDSYVLSTKLTRRVRRAAGLPKEIEDTDALNDTLEVADKKSSRRLEDNDWISSRFWIDPLYYKVKKCEFTDLRTMSSVIVEYQDFHEEHESHYPKKISIKSTKDKTQFNFEILRLNTENKYNFDFYIDPELTRKNLFNKEHE
ncbi:MAG: hypothetical protein RIR06_895 [Bacteroidota bacterium]